MQEPNFSHHTEINSSSNRYSVSSSYPQHHNVSTASLIYDTSGNLGYGIGRLLRETFDRLYNGWHHWWYPALSKELLAQRRQVAVYRKRLEAAMVQLDLAVEDLRKNPHAKNSVERFKQIAKESEAYLSPAPTEKLRHYQRGLLNQLRTKIEKLKVKNLSRRLLTYLPSLPPDTTSITDTSDSHLNIEDASDTKRKRSAAVQQTSGFEASFDLRTLNGNNGFVVNGIASGDQLGWSISTAGDINGDGKTDLVVGGTYAVSEVSANAGAVYVIFGGNSFSSPFSLTSLNGANGFVVNGISANDNLGYSVSTAGDINGDGKADLVLGAIGVSHAAGAAYVIFGQNNFSSSFNLTSLNGTNGFVVNGISSDGGRLGHSVNTVGDMNGDGKDDIVLGAPYSNHYAGAAYIIFGQSNFTSPFDLTSLKGANGFVVNGIVGGDQLGWSVGMAGNMNKDGKDDIVLGALGASNLAGAVYVIFGGSSFSSPFSLTSLNGMNGFVVNGILAGGILGASVSTAGDINGDGKDDIVLGAPATYSNNHVGTAYVIFGESNFASPFDLGSLHGANGFVVNGISANDNLGYSGSTAGDINGDGKADLVLGTTGVSGDEGAAYVILGQSHFISPLSLTSLNGTNGFVINGISVNDRLGFSVGAAEDINGDGKPDLVLGAPGVSNGAGAAYVIWNVPPFVIQAIPNQSIEIGMPFNFTIAPDTFTDLYGNNLTYSAHQADGSPLPDWITFDAKNCLFSGVTSSAGTTPLSVKATDTANLSTSVQFNLLVTSNTNLGTIVGSMVGVLFGISTLTGLGYGLYRRCLPKPKPISSFQTTDELVSLLEESNSSNNPPNLLPIDISSEPDISTRAQDYPKPSWHVHPKITSQQIAKDKVYELVEAEDHDKRKVIEFYQHCSVSGYEIASVRVIHNPDMNHAFALHIKKLQQRDNNPAFKAKWPRGRENPQESLESAENIEWRHVVYEQLGAISKPYQDSDYPAVHLVPMWHGTKKGILDSIFKTGYANLATTDAGFFGKGIYSAYEAEYSYRVYAKDGGALIVNWVACFSAYPVIDGDMKKLEGKGNYANYDAHFIPVVPRDPDNPDEEVYYPTKPSNKHQYTELVVFASEACLPRYLVELQRTLEKPLPLNRTEDRGVFFPSIQKEEKIVIQEAENEKLSSKIAEGKSEYRGIFFPLVQEEEKAPQQQENIAENVCSRLAKLL